MGERENNNSIRFHTCCPTRMTICSTSPGKPRHREGGERSTQKFQERRNRFHLGSGGLRGCAVFGGACMQKVWETWARTILEKGDTKGSPSAGECGGKPQWGYDRWMRDRARGVREAKNTFGMPFFLKTCSDWKARSAKKNMNLQTSSQISLATKSRTGFAGQINLVIKKCDRFWRTKAISQPKSGCIEIPSRFRVPKKIDHWFCLKDLQKPSRFWAGRCVQKGRRCLEIHHNQGCSKINHFFCGACLELWVVSVLHNELRWEFWNCMEFPSRLRCRWYFCLAILIFDCSCRGNRKMRCGQLVGFYYFLLARSPTSETWEVWFHHIWLILAPFFSVQAWKPQWLLVVVVVVVVVVVLVVVALVVWRARVTDLRTDLPIDWLIYSQTYLADWVTYTHTAWLTDLQTHWIIIGLTQWLTYSYTYVQTALLAYTSWLSCVPALLAYLVTMWETDLLHFLTYTLAYLLADVPTYLLTYRPTDLLPYWLTCLPHLLFLKARCRECLKLDGRGDGGGGGEGFLLVVQG